MSRKVFFVLVLCLFANVGFVILPDNITIPVGDLDGDSIDDSLVLTKHSLRSVAYYCVRT